MNNPSRDEIAGRIRDALTPLQMALVLVRTACPGDNPDLDHAIQLADRQEAKLARLADELDSHHERRHLAR